MVRINTGTYAVHRIIYLYHHGYLPAIVDHIDRNSQNNKIENLRDADWNLSNQNRGTFKNNTSGWKGVSFNKLKNKWEIRVMTNGKRKLIGRFVLLYEGLAALAAHRASIQRTPSKSRKP